MGWSIRSDAVHPDIETLKMLMRKTKDKRMFERYQTVLLHLQGMTYAQIVEIVGRSAMTVGNYVKAHREKGIEGLNMGQSSGRPPFLTNEQEEQLRKLVTEQRPADVGFPSEMNWTSVLIREWIERTFGIVYTDRGVRKLLHQIDFSYTKPTYTLANADPIQQESFKQDFEEVKKIT
jgi:transposase